MALPGAKSPAALQGEPGQRFNDVRDLSEHSDPTQAAPIREAYALHYGRSRNALVEIVADGNGLYRIAWPDIGLSEPVNLTRAMQAAQEWAERFFMTEHRKIGVARRLKSLDNFSWSASPMRQNRRGAA
jgi:hypothetical protein